MKAALLALATSVGILGAFNAPAYTVYMPPGNIVQNPTFSNTWTDWSGNFVGAAQRWPTMPNDNALVLTDAYQDLPTVPGQQYALDFYMAADLYFGPSVTVNVNLSGSTLETIITPAYAYNNQVNRFDQVHWQEVTGEFTAAGSTTRLEFVDLNTYDFLLASVSVIPVPEPDLLSLFVGGCGLLAISRRFRQR